MTVRIDAENKATRELTMLNSQITQMSGGFASTFGSVVPLATAAATAIAGIASAALGASVAVFRLAEATAEYGSAIFDATQKTGLTAETVSALKFAADQSGSSLEQIAGSVAKFNVLLGEANQGSEKAQKALALYGITARDTDTALAQAIETIAKMTTADQQAAAAKALFKDRTAEILPVIKSFDGDLPALMDKLRDLGVLMSDEDARAADEFGDTLDQLKLQASGVGRQFAFELMPLITGAMQSISDFMAENKGITREWGETVVDTINGAVINFQRLDTIGSAVLFSMGVNLKKNENEWVEWSQTAVSAANRVALAIATGGISEFLRYSADVGAAARNADSGTSTLLGGGSAFRTRPMLLPSGGGGGRGRGGGRSARDDSESLARRSLQAQIGGEQNNLRQWADDVNSTLETMLQTLRDVGTSDANVEKVGKAFLRLEANLKTNLADLEQFENQLHANDTAEEKSLLLQNQRMRQDELAAKITQAKLEYTKGVAKIDEERQKAANDRLNVEIDQTKELLKLEERRKELLDSLGIATGALAPAEDIRRQATNIELLAERWEHLREVMGGFSDITDIMADFGNMTLDLLDGMTQATQRAIEGWLLYGESIGQALKNALAAELAHIAAVATIKAIFELAEGFAALFLNPAAAAAHFKAAALYGIVAAAAGAGARGLSGGLRDQRGGRGAGAGAGGGGGGQTPPEPFSRVSSDAFISGQRSPVRKLAEAIDRFGAMIIAVPAGHVFQKGMQQNPGLVGQQVAADIGRNAGTGREIARKMGIR